MALVPCPACGLPRTAADADTPCPACHWADPPAPAPAPAAPAPVSPPTPAPAHRRTRDVLFGAAGAAVGVVAAALLIPPRERPAPPEPEPTSAPAPAPPAYVRVPSLPIAPPPRAVEPDDDPVVVPVPIPVPVAPDGGFAVLKVDQPDGVFAFPRLGPGNKVKLTGRVKRLTVEGLDGGAELDATGLASDGVSVAEAVDGGSVLRLKSDGGTVSFKRGVRGGSVVELDAPKSYVTFSGGPAAKAGAKAVPAVGGGSRVTVRAKSVVFGGPVTGAGTEVAITFARGGSLKLEGKVGDGAQVRFRPEHRADPPVKVTPPGTVTATGPVREDPPPE
jgi:hypothetical protein